MYAQMDQKTGEALAISKPIPLPALNIKYAFVNYQYSSEQIRARQKILGNPKWRPPPLEVVNAMVTHGRVELLAHPLSQKYLQMKWNSYGKYIHLAHLLVYLIFLFCVTAFSSMLMDSSKVSVDNKTTIFTTEHNFPNEPIIGQTAMYMSATAILFYVCISTVREILQLYQQRCQYLIDPTNLVTWLLYGSSVVMVMPMFAHTVDELQVSCASITVFLSWFTLLLNLQRFDMVGIYVVMFLEILQTLIKVLVVFSILIIAFGLAFYILLSQGGHLSFSTVPMSLLRTFSMMLGEIDFLGTYIQPFYLEDEEGRSLPYPIPAFLILGVFMVLMPILLMNLLIGLAVGDIESVRRNAQLKRLAMQVVLHTELERKLPQVLLERVDKMALIEYPNDTKCKLGFFDQMLKKWLFNPFSDDGLEMVLENNEDSVSEEIDKMKRKLKNISRALDNQHMLLRLIIQKMEIKTEADEVDEGVSPKEIEIPGVNSKWMSPRVRNKLRTALSFSKAQPPK